MARLTELRLSTLKDLDLGKIDAAFQRELKLAVEDCKDRPLENKARVVNVAFLLAPDEATDGDEVKIQAVISSKYPKRTSRVYNMVTTPNGGLKFHPDLPGDPQESTLFDGEEGNE